MRVNLYATGIFYFIHFFVWCLFKIMRCGKKTLNISALSAMHFFKTHSYLTFMQFRQAFLKSMLLLQLTILMDELRIISAAERSFSWSCHFKYINQTHAIRAPKNYLFH